MRRWSCSCSWPPSSQSFTPSSKGDSNFLPLCLVPGGCPRSPLGLPNLSAAFTAGQWTGWGLLHRANETCREGDLDARTECGWGLHKSGSSPAEDTQPTLIFTWVFGPMLRLQLSAHLQLLSLFWSYPWSSVKIPLPQASLLTFLLISP